MYKWMPISSAADLTTLEQLVDPEYAPRSVAKKLAAGLSAEVKGILIEYNYVDKDYRSAYYNFYSKKGRRYRPDCVRLHLFDGTVSFDEKTLKLTALNDPRLSDHYFGYMVLRPTGLATIGRSVLLPGIRLGACKFIIKAKHKVHLLGHRLEVAGFPSMDQHIDISICAHATCWSILRHYSERYRIYKEFLTHDITMMAHQFDPGGLIPSRGLALSQAERVFQEAGTYPVIVARDPRRPDDPSFYRQLAAYLDSGFPLFAAMYGKGHAMAVVGYQQRATRGAATGSLRHSWDETESLAVVDDNHLPYLTIPTEPGPAGSSLYSAKDIDAFIVALPEKVFYPADAFASLVPTLYKLGGVVQLPKADESIVRYFITTGSAFRRFVREHESEFDPGLIEAVMKLPFAQFVWIVEFATDAQWSAGRIGARAVIDATASLTEWSPFWIVHGQREALLFDRESVNLDPNSGMGLLQMADMGHTGFSRMDDNLRLA